MLVGDLKALLDNTSDDLEIRVRVVQRDREDIVVPIFDLGYDGELNVEIIHAEEK